MCIGLKQQYKFYRSLKKRSDRIVQTLSIEMNSYLTKLIKSIKSHGMERDELNQSKANQIKHKKRLHNMGLTSMKIIWSQFHSIYQQYSILISIEHSPKWIQ